jgi:hypothetical protein
VSLQTQEYQITTSDLYETLPILGNDGISDIVVYTARELQSDGSYLPGDIWFRRLDENGAPFGPAVQVTTGDSDDEWNDISGDHIVYISHDSTSSYAGEIMVYQISTGEHQEVRTHESLREAKIEGRLVVWCEGGRFSAQIMMYDIAWLGSAFEPLVIAGPNPTFDVEIGNRFIVWSELVDGQYDVVAYDLDSLIRMEVATTSGADETMPRAFGPWVVWQERNLGSVVTSIKAKNLDSGEVRLVADGTRGNFRPSIDGDFISYGSKSYDPETNLEIYLYQLSTMETFQVTSNPYDQYLNDVFDNRIAYVDTRNDNEDVFVSTFELISEGDISVSPLSHDFGDVELGTVSTTIATITNVGEDSLTINDIVVSSESNPDFSISYRPNLPAIISPGSTIDIEITYTPSDLGASSAILEIASDDTDEPMVMLSFSGTGVEYEPPPSEQIANILEFIDQSVEAGSLEGDGPGASGKGRLNALQNMIETAGNLIDEGRIDDACRQLWNAYRRTDGNPRPPDFVTGEAASELASQILALLDSLGWSEP